jgi:hypothetical protein
MAGVLGKWLKSARFARWSGLHLLLNRCSPEADHREAACEDEAS